MKQFTSENAPYRTLVSRIRICRKFSYKDKTYKGFSLKDKAFLLYLLSWYSVEKKVGKVYKKTLRNGASNSDYDCGCGFTPSDIGRYLNRLKNKGFITYTSSDNCIVFEPSPYLREFARIVKQRVMSREAIRVARKRQKDHERYKEQHAPEDVNDAREDVNGAPEDVNDAPEDVNDDARNPVNDAPEDVNDAPEDVNDAPEDVNDAPQRDKEEKGKNKAEVKDPKGPHHIKEIGKGLAQAKPEARPVPPPAETQSGCPAAVAAGDQLAPAGRPDHPIIENLPGFDYLRLKAVSDDKKKPLNIRSFLDQTRKLKNGRNGTAS